MGLTIYPVMLLGRCLTMAMLNMPLTIQVAPRAVGKVIVDTTASHSYRSSAGSIISAIIRQKAKAEAAESEALLKGQKAELRLLESERKLKEVEVDYLV